MENLRDLFQIMTRSFGFLNKNCCTTSCGFSGEVEISPIQSNILYEIDRQHRPSIQQVAEALGTDITTFSRQIQALIKIDLVEKTPNPKDRRMYILSLTTEGKNVATRINQQMNAYLKEVFSHMNEFEKETVIRSIQLLSQCMEKSGRCCPTKENFLV